MIITDIFAGSKQVSKVYVGTKLIWERRGIMALLGEAESKTYTTSRTTSFVLIPGNGPAVSTSYGEAVANLVITSILDFSGKAEVNTYAKAAMIPFSRFSAVGESEATSYGEGTVTQYTRFAAAGDGESTVNSDAVMRFFDALVLHSDTVINVFTRGDGDSKEAVIASGGSTITTDGNGQGHAFFLIRFAGDSEQQIYADGNSLIAAAKVASGVESSTTEGHAIGQALFFKEFCGTAESKLNAIAEMNSVIERFLSGRAVSNVITDSQMAAWKMVKFRGRNESTTQAEASGKAMPVLPPKGSAQSHIDGVAELWTLSPANAIGLAMALSKAIGTMRHYRRFQARGKVRFDTDALAVLEAVYHCIMAGLSESEVSGYGAMNPWYLPYIDEEGYLVVRQAYEATLTDGILEVI